MGFKRKLSAGALVVGLAPLVGAGPAEAEYRNSDFETAEVSVLLNGQQMSCRIGGFSSYILHDGDGRAEISAGVSVADDPGCHDAVGFVQVRGSYETAPGSNEFRFFEADTEFSGGNAVSMGFQVPGPTGPISVSHIAWFQCDNSPDRTGFCHYTVTTSPK